jgi:hypothetical protein
MVEEFSLVDEEAPTPPIVTVFTTYLVVSKG